jgi:hypothetical protein
MLLSKEKNKITLIELSIFITIWVIVFGSPVLVQYSNETLDWDQVFKNWRRLSGFLMLSLVNHFILVPYLFFRKNKLSYIFAAFLLIAVFSLTLRRTHQPPIKNGQPLKQHELRYLPNEHRPPPRDIQKRQGKPPGYRKPPWSKTPGGVPFYMNTVLVALLIIGFDTGLRTVFRWTKSEQERDQLEKEKVKSELAFLRNQVNPHFLMNTLNNIHALVDIDSEMAKDTVIRMSKLMRYLLYDTERELIPIREELSFIRSYVELMRLRISRRVKVSLNIDTFDEERQIPPLLFTSLIENAFKYGVSHRADTFVNIEFSTTNHELSFLLSNTIAQKSNEENFYSGIGLENTRKRLDILYGNRYSLDINAENEVFSVKLNLPL